MKIRKDTLPVLRPFGAENEIKEFADTIRSGWWGKGKKVEELEARFSKMVGSKYAIAVTSNTVAMDLILKAYNISDGNIISPTISFVSTAMVPLWNNCETRLCDIDSKTRNFSVEDVKNLVDSKTKAFIAVNYAGIQSDIKNVKKFFKGLIIEDCAWSCYTPGAGSHGDIAVWSFQAVKTISSGDGGIITTNSKKLYTKLKLLSFLGISSDTYNRATNKNKSIKPGYIWDFNVQSIGYKAYMNDIQASIILAQLKSLKKIIKKKLDIQEIYNARLPKSIIRPEFSGTCAFYSPSVSAKIRGKLMKYLSKKKIHTTIHYKPLHKHKIFKQERDFPIADIEWKKFISLPCHAAMTHKDILYVIHFINEFYKLKNI